MGDRWAERTWRPFGRVDPYYGVLSNEQFRADRLDAKTLDAFFQTGEEHVEWTLNSIRRLIAPEFQPTRVLDFGCGVGRLTAPLATLTGAATGVDISPGMLAEARKHGHPGLRFVETIPDELFDWVVSSIVLQHIPPQRGYGIIEQLLDRVAPGGGVTLQIMFGRTAPHAKAIGSRLIIDEQGVRPATPRKRRRKLPQGEMIMYDYDLTRVVGLFYRRACKPCFWNIATTAG